MGPLRHAVFENTPSRYAVASDSRTVTLPLPGQRHHQASQAVHEAPSVVTATTGQATAGRRVAVIAAETLFQAGIVAAVAGTFQTVGPVGTVADGQHLLMAEPPPLAVIVLAAAFPDTSLETACMSLLTASPSTAALVLVTPGDGDAVRLARKHGARGIHDTLTQPASLCAALRTLGEGGAVVQPSLVRYLVEPPVLSRSQPEALTARELTVLQLLSRGYTSRQLAQVLGTTPKGVDLTIERAMRRLGASHRAEAVATAMRLHLIE